MIRDPRTTRSLSIIAVGSLLAPGLACGSGDGPTTPVPPSDECTVDRPFISWFRDLDNVGDGQDLYMRLIPPVSAACTTGYRVFVSKAASAITDADAALAVPPARTHQLAASFGLTIAHFGDIGVDADGDPLVEGVEYILQMVGFGDGDPLLVTSGSTTMVNEDVVRTISPTIDAGSGGMETDADGNIYTADFGATLSGPAGTRIHRVTPEGTVNVWATGFKGASGNDRAENGDLFQSSIQGGTIHRVTPAGGVSTFATGISAPVGIVALPGDTLLVAGCGDNTIRRVEPDGTVSTASSSTLLFCPNGITRADDGNYYIANFSDGKVLRMTPAGVVTQVAQVPGGNAGHLVWRDGYLWVVDRAGNRIIRMTLDGAMTPVAGTGGRGLEDGPALQATLSLTNDVAFSPDGTRLYFNDVAQTVQANDVINPVVVRALIFAREEG